MASTESNLATAKTMISTIGSVVATAMVVRSVVQDYIPYEVHDYFSFYLGRLFNRFSNKLTMVIEESDGLESNEIYDAAHIYLAPKISPAARRLKVKKYEKEKNIITSMEKNEEVKDFFQGVELSWVWVCQQVESRRHSYNRRFMDSNYESEVRSFELTFHKKHREIVLNTYLPYVIQEAKSMKLLTKTMKIFTLNTDEMYGSMSDAWTPVNLDHPATFDTVAMDPGQKDMVLKDLERFVRRKDHYRKVGKAWKRGYLLYGPPGTGKSSLIAAMANYLNFHIYDLELTDVRGNSQLRRLLLATENRSILVVEDIDCTLDLKDRSINAENKDPSSSQEDDDEPKITLSGFLNFVDGLWSSCGDERIIILTTNHKEKLDPALLRPGRMDVHILMSYCTPQAFRILASNYLGVQDEHQLLGEIERLIAEIDVTPAEIAEQLLKFDEADDALSGLVHFLDEKRKENEAAAEAKKIEEMEKEKEKEKKNGSKNKDEIEEGKKEVSANGNINTDDI